MMLLTPENQKIISNAWWFSATYLLINIIIITIFRKNFVSKLFHMPDFESLKEKMISMLNFILYIGVILFSIFLTVEFDSLSFYIGTVLFILGIVLYIIAMINYGTTPSDQPVTKGIYRISRHPMQVMAIISWIGVGLATSSWLVILACIAQFFSAYPSMIAQERFCIGKYGEIYEKYLKTTPRYLLMF